ncbi:MAG: glycosyltransferase, partial [Methanomicrobiales archaeon]|nr:glycosyltransferase [Methanomicrobiales archaeon]
HALLTQWGCNHFDYVRIPKLARDLDVTFVGQPHGNRKSVVGGLQKKGIPVTTYGQGWERGRVSQREMVEIFNRSKINLNLSNSSWNIHSLFRGRQQIKGRNFEIPGCGGFLLSNYVEGIERYYTIGKEIACFGNRHEMLDRIRYYLSHPDEREEVARAGYERTLRDHTYVRRLTELFHQMGFRL